MERYQTLTYHEACRLFERDYIAEQLKRFGSISRTASMIGITRANLHAAIKRHGINTKEGLEQ